MRVHVGCKQTQQSCSAGRLQQARRHGFRPTATTENSAATKAVGIDKAPAAPGGRCDHRNYAGCGALLDWTQTSDLMIDPPSRVRGRPDLVIAMRSRRSFARTTPKRYPVTRGALFRLERASYPDEAKNAADALRWWLEDHRRTTRVSGLIIYERRVI